METYAKFKHFRPTLMLIFSLGLCLFCSNSTEPLNSLQLRASDININILDYSQLPYTGTSIAPVVPYYPIDEDSIPVFFFNDTAYYHPITIA